MPNFTSGDIVMPKRTFKPKMTPIEAITFEHESPMNMLMFYEFQEQNNELRDEDSYCTCEPYQDVFTYNRWKAQGYQVRRGEHGCKVTTWVPKDKDNPDAGVFPRNATVFCRCQVDKV